MSLKDLNELDDADRGEALFRCCGSRAWVNAMLRQFPFATIESLFDKATELWLQCEPADWLEAFSQHPRIGDLESLGKKFASTSTWASGEQIGVNAASEEVLVQLQSGNEAYEKKFGYIFIVCATGKTAEEMLALLKARLPNDHNAELNVAMHEQMKITIIRLQKLLS